MVRKLIVLLVLLMAFPLVTQAQDSVETSVWRWPETGIQFNYPADWRFRGVEGYEFVLQTSEDPPRGMGLQVFPLQEGDTVQVVFEGIAEDLGVEAEAIEVGGTDAMKVALPDDSGRQALLVGYALDESNMAIISFSGATEKWDEFSAQIDGILQSAEISIVDLDVETLNAQMQANFEANQTLSVGEADAGVRLVEVLDFSCPHCANYTGSIDRVISDYVTSGDVKLDFYAVTFVGHEYSEVAANAQYCAASLGFGWDMHDLLFHLQRTEGREAFTNENLIEEVGALEADTDGFADCLTARTFNDLVERDAEISDGFDVQGTPTLLVAASDEEPAYFLNTDDEPIRGAVRLAFLYDRVDGLLDIR